ncbi:MAG TPA: hypothetical protein VIX89_18230 [Bryobacteraceae bacterium]
MRPIGFSTGALACADFHKGLGMLHETKIEVVELSALREVEIGPLVAAVDSLDLSQFTYVSVHAPSLFPQEHESQVVDLLQTIVDRDWPVIVHPDAIHDHRLWRKLGACLCIENMDKRKPIGRSVGELLRVFDSVPDASFCFDIGHARQFDSTMTEAYFLLTAFRQKLRQVHVSEVNTSSKHDVMSYASILAFREVAHLIPVNIPLILETPTPPRDLAAEIERAREALPICVAV